MRRCAQNLITAFLKHKSAVAVVTALFAVTIWIFYDSLWYDFVYSDLPVIKYFVDSPCASFWHIFTSQPRWLSFLLNKALFMLSGDNVLPYRISCLILHLANGLLAFVIIMLAGKRAKAGTFLHKHVFAVASLTMLLLLLHPAQSQTVLHIPQMQLEGLVLFFALLSMLAMQLVAKANTVCGRGWSIFLIATAAFGATGSKEIAVMLPFLVCLFDWFFIAVGSVRDLLHRWYLYAISGGIIGAAFFSYGTLRPGFIIRLAYAAVQNDSGNVLTASAQMPITLEPYALSQFKVMVHYLKIFLWPADLCYDYEMMLSYHWDSIEVLLPAAFCLGLITLAIWWYKRYGSNLLSFGIGWFLLAIVPSISIFPTSELVSDYKTYLASFGIMLALSYLIIELGRIIFRAWPMLVALGSSTVQVCAVGLFAYCLGTVTMKRQMVWENEYTFWKDIMDKVPKPRALNNFAVALWHRGSIDDAVSYFEQAIAKDHWYAEPHANLGTIYQVKGNEEKALYHYARAIEIGEGHPQLFNNLGQLHASRGAVEAAEVCFLRAIASQAPTPNPFINLGRLYEQQGRRQDALKIYQQATARRIQNTELLYACGTLAYELKELDAAIDAFKQLDSAYEQTAFLLGCCYYDQQRYEQAAASLALASKKDPLNIKYIFRYAEALMHAERYAEAAAMYTLCMTHEQASAPASLHKIYCLYRAHEQAQAEHELEMLLAHNASPQIVAEAMRLKQKYVT
ncbi:tetratricopeptide repeat protein [Candidatus Dependentiae bacterium]|nr:tetratricopeptide repeat protein [Candidatus Dependentiae bacterium]